MLSREAKQYQAEFMTIVRTNNLKFDPDKKMQHATPAKIVTKHLLELIHQLLNKHGEYSPAEESFGLTPDKTYFYGSASDLPKPAEGEAPSHPRSRHFKRMQDDEFRYPAYGLTQERQKVEKNRYMSQYKHAQESARKLGAMLDSMGIEGLCYTELEGMFALNHSYAVGFDSDKFEASAAKIANEMLEGRSLRAIMEERAKSPAIVRPSSSRHGNAR